MSRYQQAFQKASSENRIAFIPFAVAGDPDISASEKIFKTYIDAGADVLEIGYPFSDPMADGAVNQRAAQRALSAGMNLSNFYKMIEKLRAYSNIPFGLLCYANTVHHAGYDNFSRRAASAGLDSLLVADMPPEESEELLEAMRGRGLGSVFIISELTPESRIRFICGHTTEFVYVVSRLGTTGIRSEFSASTARTVSRLKKHTKLPLCVGFGISSPYHVKRVGEAGAHGAIVGSKLVSIIEKSNGKRRDMYDELYKTVRRLKNATRIKPG
jgi:tryptophan synthase alpha chain